jgi:hypothetical protein
MAVNVKGSGGGFSPSQMIKKKPSYAEHLGAASATKYGQAQAVIDTEKKTSGQTVQEGSESELVHPGLETDGHKLYVSGSRTINLGNYESVKISVGLEVPTTKAGLSDMYEFATDWVSERLQAAVHQLKS